MSSEVLKARSATGVAARRGDSNAVLEARRNLAAAKLAAYIESVVAEAPPLTDEQLDHIALLLRPSSRSSSHRGR